MLTAEVVDFAFGTVAPGALLQDYDELQAFVALVHGAESVLEIGMHEGGTAIVWCELAARVVGVDLPSRRRAPGCGLDRAGCIRRNARLARQYPGFRGLLGDSCDPRVVQLVARFAPFDLVFIDGNHDYPIVRQDWQHYGPMAKKWVALHDVNDPTLGPSRLWSSIRATHQTTTIGTRAACGIGVVFV